MALHHDLTVMCGQLDCFAGSLILPPFITLLPEQTGLISSALVSVGVHFSAVGFTLIHSSLRTALRGRPDLCKHLLRCHSPEVVGPVITVACTCGLSHELMSAALK